ncbi:pyrroline-5-carboxylate reductase [Roseomonas indoligenes]|uniref:Pyrroline-5-carboxylate reductase n=1 Tax=Roseomonas indoligenes TaxID=2820811 RepID=A0A940MYU5_9PROT|nr:pyrroline-5-carboxylate reductase [Pararoseomonas indoligenes]MBP0493697.1 pyrroline-5-carboxylate reductase [Pararoseomonas indoligenes]
MSAAMLPPVLLVGCGKMGGALLSGWLARGLSRAVIVEPHHDSTKPYAGRPEITLAPDIAAIPSGFVPEAVVLATKPQQSDEVLPGLRPFARGGALFLSIMAGKTLSGLDGLLEGAAVVRAMPNTPAAIGQGFTVACAGRRCTEAQKTLADRLLTATGEVAWVEAESLIDPVTAISGGGPAYVFLLAEMLERAGLDQGIPPDLARRMARATVSGSAALLARSKEDASVLRQNVTSPKGTTEQALAVLMAEHAWPYLIPKAIEAATRRSRELAG